NGYAGTSEINNVSVLGKVMQYDMQLEAPPRYRDQALLVDRYVNVTHLNVWHVVTENPEFATDHYALAGAFGRAIVLADPGRYLVRSLDVALTHNTDVDRPLLHLAPQGPLRLPLAALARYTEARYAFYRLLAAFTLVWALFPLLSRRKSPLDVLGPVAAMTGYGMLIIGLGGFDEYGRYHTVYLPASNLLVWGTLLLNVVLANRARASVRPSLPALVLLEIVAVVLLTAAPGFALSGVVTIVVALLQGVVMWLALTDEPLEARQLQAVRAVRQ